MAPIAKRRRVLGPHSHPRVWCPRPRVQRGGDGGRAEGVRGGIVSEGTHPLDSFPFCCFRFTDGMCSVSFNGVMNPLATFSGLCWP